MASIVWHEEFIAFSKLIRLFVIHVTFRQSLDLQIKLPLHEMLFESI
jgi:hypothetical protein